VPGREGARCVGRDGAQPPLPHACGRAAGVPRNGWARSRGRRGPRDGAVVCGNGNPLLGSLPEACQAIARRPVAHRGLLHRRPSPMRAPTAGGRPCAPAAPRAAPARPPRVPRCERGWCEAMDGVEGGLAAAGGRRACHHLRRPSAPPPRRLRSRPRPRPRPTLAHMTYFHPSAAGHALHPSHAPRPTTPTARRRSPSGACAPSSYGATWTEKVDSEGCGGAMGANARTRGAVARASFSRRGGPPPRGGGGARRGPRGGRGPCLVLPPPPPPPL